MLSLADLYRQRRNLGVESVFVPSYSTETV